MGIYVADDGRVSYFATYAPNSVPGKILRAIVDALDVDIVSEYEPQYWGFNTHDELDAAMDALQKGHDEWFHAEMLKFLNGEPHDIRPGAVGMCGAEIAKKLVEEDPASFCRRTRANSVIRSRRPTIAIMRS